MNDMLSSYERAIQGYLKDELRVLNAHLPERPKLLADLLCEEHPHIVCRDGSTHLFKKKELDYLTGLVKTGEQKALLLPLLIEIKSGRRESVVLRAGEVGEKVISQIIGMPLTHRQGKTVIYKPQLALLRKMLKTTIQYVFSAALVE